ncbi:hypothetical protein [Nostoc sp. 106C]|uniref:hypothetical protein n=1 Tax=Nostoc sp. 106C TaxID=1932667 RepID=UPI000A3AC050|nr:hypothetical protein [Nostoc sp. 106C]OUL28799.1 hypothetical protein BV375_16915 [Nostoc sp. 106C]
MNSENSEIENIPQPDPAWDYYILWHSLHHIKAKINAALKLIANNEDADSEIDEQIRILLNPTSEKLTEIVEQLAYDDD